MNNEFTPAWAEIGLETVKHRHEESFTLGRALTVGDDHEANQAGRSLPQAAPGLIGGITEFLCTLNNVLPCFGVDTSAPVQGT